MKHRSGGRHHPQVASENDALHQAAFVLDVKPRFAKKELFRVFSCFDKSKTPIVSVVDCRGPAQWLLAFFLGQVSANRIESARQLTTSHFEVWVCEKTKESLGNKYKQR